jgi:hypothetical protein
MSAILKRGGLACQLLPDEIAAIAEYIHIDREEAVALSRGLLGRPDGIELVAWALQDHAEKARWRCDDAEATHRQEVYQRFLARSLRTELTAVLYSNRKGSQTAR